jgi:hypothetical protein
MSDTPQPAAAGTAKPQGSMYLYTQPEFLNREDHGSLGWRTPEKPFEFAARISSVPLVASEMSTAQKHYPVVFSGKEDAVPLAVVSILKDRNMFVRDDGQWEPGTYIPSYLRRHPFATATGPDDQFAIVIDRASKAISEDPETPFFSGDTVSEQTQSMIDFCGRFEAERRRTKAFSDRLAELDLLTDQQVTAPGDDAQRIASYVAIDVEKLNGLAPEVLQELHQNGYLSFIFAHLFSLENWNRLLARRSAMMAAAGVPAAGAPEAGVQPEA